MSSFAMFPGQGSQHSGMARELLTEFPKTAVVFEEASDACKLDLKKLCVDASDSDLSLTEITQPAILTTSVAIWKALHDNLEPSFVAFAGHSLGEYSAAVCAGYLPLARAAFLVRERGAAMQRAVPVGVGAMAAVLNADATALQDLCAAISKEFSGKKIVSIANFNSPAQLVVAGHEEAVAKLIEQAPQTLKARCVRLPVSAPFHSALMSPAREYMKPLLEDTPLLSSKKTMIPNTTGEVADAYQVQYLIDQIDSPVQWVKTMNTVEEKFAPKHCVEIGPGKVLAGLAKRCLKNPANTALIGASDVKSAITALNA